VAGTPDLRWFLDGGRTAAACLRDAVGRHGTRLEDVASILDFGCGCGRVIRHLSHLSAQIDGTDRDARAIAWCRRNLPFARFEVNDLQPPLNYADEAFSLIYALSVFTHLPEALQRPWLEELVRVLAPGGFLLLSFHGLAYLPELSDEEQRHFRAGELVVRASGAPGANSFGAYHPEQYLKRILPLEVSLMEIMPEGAQGNPRQDLAVLRRGHNRRQAADTR
jgi:SAM-dependent methyltransferase